MLQQQASLHRRSRLTAPEIVSHVLAQFAMFHKRAAWAARMQRGIGSQTRSWIVKQKARARLAVLCSDGRSMVAHCFVIVDQITDKDQLRGIFAVLAISQSRATYTNALQRQKTLNNHLSDLLFDLEPLSLSVGSMTSLYARLLSGNQLLEVGVDDKNILIHDTRSRIKAIGTKGLNGCTCIVILGKSAIILAHISPYPGEFDANTNQNIPQQSHQHHESSLTAVTSLMKRHIKHFPASTTAWGVFASNEKSGAVQPIIDQVRNCLRAVSLDMRSAYYQEADISGIIPPKGELVSFFKDNKPQLILERKQLWPEAEHRSQSSVAGSSFAGSSTAGSAIQPTTSRAPPQTISPRAWVGYPMRTTDQGATLLSCVISGRSFELAASWPQGSNLPMVWIRNSWSQTERRPNDDVLLLRDPNGALI